MAKCRVCGIELTDENWRSCDKKKHSCICMSCDYQKRKGYYKAHKEEIKERQKKWRKAHKREIQQYNKQHWEKYKHKRNKSEIKEWNLKRLYNITLDQFNQILESQDNRCAICGKEFTENNPPCVDHNHETKQVRALLCFKCNAGLGSFDEDPKLFDKAKSYVVKYNSKV